MYQIVLVTVCGALLAGCATAPKYVWLRDDGQRISASPVLGHDLEMARTVCLGEREKAALSGTTFTSGTWSAVAAAQDRSAAADQVQVGCMATKGYVLTTEDKAEAKQSELAAIAQERQREQQLASTGSIGNR